MTNDQVTLQEVLSALFTFSKTDIKQQVVVGTGQIKNTTFNILGTTEQTFFGVDEALEMAGHVIDWVQKGNKDPIILLTDVVGQKLTMRDEWLGMYAYFAHLLKCLHVARHHGNRIITLIYNQAIGGSFIAFGMMADRIFALKNAKLAVMWLEGMAKITKLDLDLLRHLSESTPVFAPGVENFKKLGGLHGVLSLEKASETLLKVSQDPNCVLDNRAELGKKYGGRTKAFDIIKAIEGL